MTGAPADPRASRSARLARLADTFFDVAIIGGGATGAAIARDAALRGLRVALCEHGDFAGQTSGQSSKLLHGGLRYLQYLELHLVFEGLRERGILMHTAPHLCRPVEFVFPAYRGEHPTLLELGVGVSVYNALALGRPPTTRARWSASEAVARAPLLRSAGLQGAQLYADCQTDDARLVLEHILDAEIAGATCASYLAVTALDQSPAGALRGLRAHDRITGAQLTIGARTVVNATGPFSDATASLEGFPCVARPQLRPTLGVHLVISADRLPTGGRAFVLRTPCDNRLFFALPDGAFTVVGTTDTDFVSPGARPPALEHEIRARGADVRYLLDAANSCFPAARLRPHDVVSTFAGLRPLVADPGASTSATSREHTITTDARGLLTIAGGKLTTMREMGENAVDRLAELCRARGHEAAIKPCTTRTRPLPGSDGHRANALTDLVAAEPSLATAIADPLAPTLADVVFALRREHALTLDDVLRRRTRIFHHTTDQGAAAAPTVAALMARELGWSIAERDAALAAYTEQVERVNRWRDEPT